MTRLTIEQLPTPVPPTALPQSFKALPHFFLLESTLVVGQARYSIAGAEPVRIRTEGSPFEILKETPKVRSDLPFAGGWVGYLGYELYPLLEPKVPLRNPDLIPNFWLGYYDSFYLHDHQNDVTYIASGGPIEKIRAHFKTSGDSPCRGNRGGGTAPSPPPSAAAPFPSLVRGTPPRRSEMGSNFSREEYLTAVRRIKDYIAAGDCYQVNLSQRFSTSIDEEPWEIYRRLAATSPAPYAAFLNLGNAQVLSSSPECFLKVEGRDVITRPIKGTRGRGATHDEDERLKRELAKSPKDRAELLMITDLERNDLGRVCKKIFVESLSEIETFAQVHHLVATIHGKLAAGKTVADLMTATFPGGSITGAPKIRAMEIIRELETVPRNVYTGAIGYLSANGKAEWNIAIRTMIIKKGTAYFWSGGGIVADSDAQAEYEETLTKASGMMKSLDPDGRDDRSLVLKGPAGDEGCDNPGQDEEVVDPDRMEPGEQHHHP